MHLKIFLKKKESAFTLIEVMIVIAIISVTSAIMLVSVSSQRVARDIQQSIQQAAAGIREVQNYALTGKKNSLGGSACYFGFGINPLALNTYQYLVSSRDPVTGNCGNPVVIQTVTLAGGVTFSDLNPNNVYFALPRGETATWNGSSFVNLGSGALPYQLNKSSQSASVCVYAAGLVKETVVGGTCP
ncbi:MAG: type II secretion system protein [Candidatus Moraniibacteriota bacterium]